MGSKRLGILFLASIILAFFAGYFSSIVIPPDSTNQFQDPFEQITEDFRNFYYYDITDAQSQDAFIASMEATINAYGEANQDPYTRLVSHPLSLSPTGDESFVGIGISFLMENLDLRVSYVYPNGAAVDKLYPNDLITGIVMNSNRIYFNTLSSETEVMSYLGGSLDDEITFIVTDPDLNETEVTITYQEIFTPTAYTISMPSANLAYIKITEFSGYVLDVTVGTSKVFKDTLNQLEDEILLTDSASKTLIIDLRDNPGGALTALHNSNESSMIPGIIQQLFTRNIEQPVFQMIPRSGDITNFYGGLVEPKDYQIVALVNENSASAAEVLASAIKTYGQYELYGQPTFGKGVYQNMMTLMELNNVRYSLVYTEGEWFYQNGLNVSTNPLDVNLIEQSGIHTLNMPVYHGEVSYNEVNSNLKEYQAFLNYYFDYQGLDLLRIDGYFDHATQMSIEDFQSEQGLTITGTLNRETAIKIHQIYMNRMQDITYDNQLQNLISLLED
ncbi:MAG: peptidoglycan-binding protein [Acholeplasmataceae bacterium]|nr:peptidoglycan-binding protein [Acholeplasmataceae bacterium]